MSSIKEKVQEIIQNVRDTIENYSSSPESLKEFISFKQQFQSDFSDRNLMLIHHQYSTASKVQSYKKWQDEGIQVRKGQKAILILAPNKVKEYFKGTTRLGKYNQLSKENKELAKLGKLEFTERLIGYRPVPVFDIQQTNAEKDQLPEYLNNFSVSSSQQNAKELYQAIDSYRKDLGIKLLTNRPKDLSPDVKGVYGVFGQNCIWVEENENIAERSTTYLHELGHAAFKEENKNLSLVQREYVAEMFSATISQYFGIESTRASAHYLEGYLKVEKDMTSREKLLFPIIEKVSSATGEIENRMNLQKECYFDQSMQKNEESQLDQSMQENENSSQEYTYEETEWER